MDKLTVASLPLAAALRSMGHEPVHIERYAGRLAWEFKGTPEIKKACAQHASGALCVNLTLYTLSFERCRDEVRGRVIE